MIRYLSLICLAFFSVLAKANVLQYITGLSYSNPAELFKIKHNMLILGGTGFAANIGFSGNVLNFNTFQYDEGRSLSEQSTLLPYGRIATRVNDKWVIGVDITQPFNSNLSWGSDAITRYAATETLMTDMDISPRFSLQLTPKLYAGAGVNFNFLANNETNWALPVNQSDYSTLVNRTSGFGLGYNFGFYYLFNQTNFLNVAYYSAIRQNTRGESFFAGDINNDIEFNFHLPATTLLSYIHLFSPTWLINLQVFRTEWNINQYARIYNTAARPPLSKHFIFTMKYSDSFAYAAAIRHQLTDKSGVVLLGLIDNGPEKDNLRTINFPSDTQYLIGISADYQINKMWSLELLYGHVISNTRIANSVTLGGTPRPFTTGRVDIDADVIDLRIKVQA